MSKGVFVGRFLSVVILGGVAFAQSAPNSALVSGSSTPAEVPGDLLVSQPANASAFLPDLPAVPKGKSTVVGGAIRDVDGVRDQLTLNVFGTRPMKVLFDERTQVYRDGTKASLRDLHAGEHVSVETMLDGTAVFARSIHMLSQSPDGQCQGQVLSYDRSNGELMVRDSLSPAPIKLRVSSATKVSHQGQESSSGDLTPGTLISADFQADNDGKSVARNIAVLATPGSAFVFSGNVVFLDLHSGQLALLDSHEGKRYEISFDPDHFVISRDLHEGADVTVTANFDGAHYSASAVTVNSSASK